MHGAGGAGFMKLIRTKYLENKIDLAEKIRSGELKPHVKESDKPHACYFCQHQIKGPIWEIVVKDQFHGKERIQKYYMDDQCYKDSKTTTRHKGMAFSQN